MSDDGDSEDSVPPIVFQVAEKYRNPKLEITDTIEWSPDHAKILYLISLFAKPPVEEGDEEGWIRSLPLLVLMYEGIVSGTFEEPDYAPCCNIVSQDGHTRRVWMNVSQEGKAFIDDLREKTLLNGLKMMTEDGQPVTSFQCSLFGLSLVEQIPEELKAQVVALVYPTGVEGGPRKIRFDPEEGCFWMTTDGGYNEQSEISECEDISYVSSPYLPECLRENDRPNNSNKHRAHEVADGGGNVAVDTSEAVTLSNVHAMIAEWIPFGANQIVALNERLGALDRNQGGFFTNQVDEDPTSTNFDVPPGLTSVKILDFDFVRFTNFEAEINYPNDEGIIQIEEFGMHLDMDGTIVYGMFIEAIGNRLADDLSVDDLSRVMVDIHQDSSEIMDDIISAHQKELMQTVFMGDSDNRPKFNLLMCDGITPALSGEFFMDRSEREYEIKQIVGDVVHGTMVGGTDTLILGREGIVYAGPHATETDNLLIANAFIAGKEVFLRAYFIRMFILNNEIDTIRDLIATYLDDPHKVDDFRTRLSESSSTIIQMTELLGYLEESIRTAKLPPRASGGQLMLAYDALNIEHQFRDLRLRTFDLRKLVEGAGGKLDILRLQGTSVNKRLLDVVVKGMDVNFQGLVAATASDARAAIANEIMNIVFAGNMIFDLIDRVDGDDTLGYEGVDSGGGGVHWILMVFRPIYSVPGFFFVVNVGWFLMMTWFLQTFMRFLIDKTLNARTIRKIMFLKVKLKNAVEYVRTKTLISSDTVASDDGIFWKIAWKDGDKESHAHWGGDPPHIVCEIDLATGFMMQVNMNWNYQTLPWNAETVVGRWVDELCNFNVFHDMNDNVRRKKSIALAAPWMPKHGTDHVNTESYQWRKSLKPGDTVVFDAIERRESKIIKIEGTEVVVKPTGPNSNFAYRTNLFSKQIVPTIDYEHPEKPLTEEETERLNSFPFNLKAGDFLFFDLLEEETPSRLVSRTGTHLLIKPWFVAGLENKGNGSMAYHVEIGDGRIRPPPDEFDPNKVWKPLPKEEHPDEIKARGRWPRTLKPGEYVLFDCLGWKPSRVSSIDNHGEKEMVVVPMGSKHGYHVKLDSKRIKKIPKNFKPPLPSTF
jgi:WD repeat-containing protein 35